MANTSVMDQLGFANLHNNSNDCQKKMLFNYFVEIGLQKILEEK